MPLTLEVTKVSLASSEPTSDNESSRIAARHKDPVMAVAKLKRPKEDQFEELAERIATDIDDRAAKMTPKERARADSETRKIATQVQRRTR
jgi:hypothetical protein